MGKLILVTGGNGSGKSAYAERLISEMSGPRIYLATMIPQTEENRARIERHRRRRAGMGFSTVECPGGIAGIPVTEDAVVLLEDVSNFCANLMFNEAADKKRILDEIAQVQARCAVLVAVTIGGLEEADYTGETADYIRSLKAVNHALASRAATVVAMRGGSPHFLKRAGEEADDDTGSPANLF